MKKLTPENQWWYDTKTGEVTQGKKHSWEHRLGPYPTEAAARLALAQAQQRTAQADAQDAAWDDWD